MRRLPARCAGLVCLFAVAAVGRAEDIEQAQLLRQRANCPPPCLPAPYQPGMPGQPGQPGQPSPFGPNQPNAQNQPTPQADEGARGAALASGEGALPNVIGDLLNPDELLPFPLNSIRGFPAALLAARSLKAPAQLPNFKIAEDENVRPIDRVYGGFNYFNDVNGRINRLLGAQLGQLNAHRETLGVEKTFWQGEASLGMRLPINTLYVNGTPFPQLNGTFTSVGDLSFIFKRILWERRPDGLFLSGGLLWTVPTGQESFGGGGFARSARDVTFQPFLGYIVPFEKLYVQGFWSVSMPTDWGRDVTMIFNDISVGYRLYRDRCGDRFVTAVTPLFELHVNTPLNHRGAFNGPAGTPDTVVFTEGLTIEVRRKAQLTFAVCEPITDFQPFDIEAVVQLNWRF